MRYRTYGRLGWQVSDIGYGMWGMGGWKDANDVSSLASLDHAISRGCNFFDTAWAYGDGHSERLLRDTLKRYPGRVGAGAGTADGDRLIVATKVPPKNRVWPGKSTTPISDVFPYDYIVEMTKDSLTNLGVERLDLQQLHVWSDTWADDDGWKRAAEDLKKDGLIEGFGISVNRWEPENVLKALETGLVDSVQVVYNIFDQAPEDALFPACERLNVAVIARVPFDEGSLTGTLKLDSTWPEGDWRNLYFTPENLKTTLARVEQLEPLVPSDETLSELALRFILHHPAVSTTIPGMRKVRHVDQNLAVSDAPPLEPRLLTALRTHRWDRTHVIP